MNIYNIVYETKCLVNNKIYIGVHSTNNLNDGYLGSGKLLHFAIEKYGKDAFIRKTLYTFNTREEACRKEAEIVSKTFIARSDTYNITEGGDVPPSPKGRKVSKETRRKLSEAKKGNTNWLGKKHSEKAKEKISKANTGKKRSAETLMKMSIANTGNTHTKETREKMSKAKMGKPRKQVTCPHCSKTGGEGIMNRWHFHNCSTLSPSCKFKFC